MSTFLLVRELRTTLKGSFQSQVRGGSGLSSQSRIRNKEGERQNVNGDGVQRIRQNFALAFILFISASFIISINRAFDAYVGLLNQGAAGRAHIHVCVSTCSCVHAHAYVGGTCAHDALMCVTVWRTRVSARRRPTSGHTQRQPHHPHHRPRAGVFPAAT